ncbi:MAG TPA: hypothetical protein VHL31_07720 [Geminicoccus sp.]|jgi:hypothetical protein|uniref:hypothetical protein n=1 Tax=Geminicoccus sp. TaxID=2024832 RepID=UPI002E369432|nr:hypothetical protein [Geminicoccus sp.]HEX2526175.1 hypothetical protein [Geminicoccus sp.]
MTDGPDAAEAAEKLRLFRLWKQTDNDRYLAAAQQLRGAGLNLIDRLGVQPRKRGRPRESDFRLLHDVMHEAVRSGMSPAQAAEKVVEEATGGGTRENKAKRLAAKYRERRAFIDHVAEAAAREREAFAKAGYVAEEFQNRLETERDEEENSPI